MPNWQKSLDLSQPWASEVIPTWSNVGNLVLAQEGTNDWNQNPCPFSYGTAIYKKPSKVQRLWIPEVVNDLQERQSSHVNRIMKDKGNCLMAQWEANGCADRDTNVSPLMMSLRENQEAGIFFFFFKCSALWSFHIYSSYSSYKSELGKKMCTCLKY